MSIDCFCDYEPASFYIKFTRKARKAHRCEECSRPILPGEKYELATGKWDWISTFKTCQHCVSMRDFMRNSVPCFCWAHGSMRDDLREAMEDAYGRAREEVRGLAFRIGRMEVARRRHEAIL